MKFKPYTFKLSLLVTRSFRDIQRYRQLIKSRKKLLTLDDDRLLDIGLTREEAQKEAKKSFWVSEANQQTFDNSFRCLPIKRRKSGGV